jgi:hypothetical protein
MPRTLLPDDDLDRILIRLASEIVDSDTIIAAFLALHVANRQGNDTAILRALDDIRALAGLTRLPEPTDAGIYRLCSNCQRVHAAPGCTNTR